MFRNLPRGALGGDRYLLMRNSSKPLWETAELQKCGRIKFKVKKFASPSFLDSALLSIIGETMGAALAPADDVWGIEWGGHGDSRPLVPEDSFALWHKCGDESSSTMSTIRRFFGTFCDTDTITPFRSELCPRH